MATKIILSDGSQSDASIPSEIKDSRVVRQAAQRNAAEKMAYQEQQRHLDAERKVSKAHHAREEKELRAQLRRLQEEQQSFMEEGLFDYHSEVCSVADEEDLMYEPSAECINPYPIMFPSSARSTPRTSAQGNRRMTGADFDDDTLCSSTLPSLRSTSRALTSASSSVACTPCASASTIPGADLKRTESMKSVLSTSPREQGAWVGDPEAISSVRRPRKSIAQQRMEHKWTRSQSLKEKTASVKIETPRRKSISRSTSMRESPRQNPRLSPGVSEGGTLLGGHQWSRSGSLKESRNIIKSIESLNESLSTMDVTPCGTPPPHQPRIIHRQSTGRHYESSPSSPLHGPESRSSVWGFLADPLPDTYLHVQGSPPITKPKRQKKLSNPALIITNPTPDLNIDGPSSPLPPITGTREINLRDDQLDNPSGASQENDYSQDGARASGGEQFSE